MVCRFGISVSLPLLAKSRLVMPFEIGVEEMLSLSALLVGSNHGSDRSSMAKHRTVLNM